MSMDSDLDGYTSHISRSFQNDFDDVLPDRLVVSESETRWIDPSLIANPARIGPVIAIPTRSFDISFQILPANQATDMQRHAHEAVHYVIEGRGFSEIGARKCPWQSGDFIYTPPWVWHRHYNALSTDARLLIVENSRLLEALGVHRRQSVGLMDYATLRDTEQHATSKGSR